MRRALNSTDRLNCDVAAVPSPCLHLATNITERNTKPPSQKKAPHHHSQHSHKKTHRMLNIVKHTSAGLGTHRHCLASKRYDVDRCVGGVRQRVVLGHVLAPSGGVLC